MMKRLRSLWESLWEDWTTDITAPPNLKSEIPDLWIPRRATRPTDLQIFLEHQQKSESRYHERISELISTLDKIVTAKYDRPIHARVEPNVAQAPLPQHTLSDVLSDDDDESFVSKASEIL